MVAKLLRGQRGGYCFEQNGLLLDVLEAVGFSVRPLSARVRYQQPREAILPRTHLFLRVDLDGAAWLVDVGFGGFSVGTAIRLDVGDAQQTPHDVRRILAEDGRRFHQMQMGDVWHDLNEFTGEEMPFIDRQVANWYTSTHPASSFRHRLVAARGLPGGRRVTLLNRELHAAAARRWRRCHHHRFARGAARRARHRVRPALPCRHHDFRAAAWIGPPETRRADGGGKEDGGR